MRKCENELHGEHSKGKQKKMRWKIVDSWWGGVHHSVKLRGKTRKLR